MGARGDAGRVRFLARLAVFAALLITSASSGEADADAQLAGARVSGPAGEAFGGPGRELRAAIDDREVDDYHYIFSTDCKPYMDWQSVARAAADPCSASPGRFARILVRGGRLPLPRHHAHSPHPDVRRHRSEG